MSSNALIREPSWEGLAPSLPQWIPADPVDSATIRDAAGLDGQLSVLSFAGIKQSMFRLEASEQPALFLKLIPYQRAESALRAETIGRWLAERGVRTTPALAGFPRQLPDGRLVIAMPYVDGRRAAPEIADCVALANSVAFLHRTIADHPDREQWRGHTLARLDELSSVRHDCAKTDACFGPAPGLLRDLASDRSIDFIVKEHQHRPLHGDLNPGNVLIVDTSAYLLDFEDVFHSVLPVCFEIALIVERFILVRSDDEMAIRLGRAFIDRYAEQLGNRSDLDFDPVAVLRALALRSLCVLALAERQGTPISRSEWHKFFTLERQARERAPTIRAAFQGEPV